MTTSSKLSLLFCPKNGSSKFLHSVGTAPPHYMASIPEDSNHQSMPYNTSTILSLGYSVTYRPMAKQVQKQEVMWINDKIGIFKAQHNLILKR
jgi:hypothetical protein